MVECLYHRPNFRAGQFPIFRAGDGWAGGRWYCQLLLRPRGRRGEAVDRLDAVSCSIWPQVSGKLRGGLPIAGP